MNTLTRFAILSKRACLRPILWAELLLLLCCCILVAHTIIPTGENMRILVLNEDGDGGAALQEALLNSDSYFTFEECSDRDDICAEVQSGKAECGLIIERGYEEGVEERVLEDLLTLVTSNYTTKGAIAEETIFAVFFKQFSEQILEGAAGELFTAPEAKAEILSRNEQYLAGDRIFRVEYHSIGADGEEVQARTAMPLQPFRGLVAIVLMLHLMLIRLKSIEEKEGYEKVLSGGSRICFICLRDLAEGMPIVLAGWIINLIFAGDLSPLAELGALLVLLVLTCLWTELFALLFRRRESYLGGMVAALLLTLLLCPVFVDVSALFPVFSKIQSALPAGNYFHFLNYLL